VLPCLPAFGLAGWDTQVVITHWADKRSNGGHFIGVSRTQLGGRHGRDGARSSFAAQPVLGRAVIMTTRALRRMTTAINRHQATLARHAHLAG
jgi:hypothetical protein